MAKCCAEPCEADGVVHLFVGRAVWPIKETTDYTGGSFCSWDHLRAWMDMSARHDLMTVPWFADDAETVCTV